MEQLNRKINAQKNQKIGEEMYETSSTLDKIQEGYALFMQGIDMLVNLQYEEKVNDNEYLSNMLQYKIHKAMEKSKEMENALQIDNQNNDLEISQKFPKKYNNRQKMPIQGDNDLVHNIKKNIARKMVLSPGNKRVCSRSLERETTKNKPPPNRQYHDFLSDEKARKNFTNKNYLTPKPKPPKAPIVQKIPKGPKTILDHLQKTPYAKSPLPKKANAQRVSSEFALTDMEKKIISFTNNRLPAGLKVIFKNLKKQFNALKQFTTPKSRPRNSGSLTDLTYNRRHPTAEKITKPNVDFSFFEKKLEKGQFEF